MKKSDLEKKILSQCKDCNQSCCRYITEKIRAPRTLHDFDGLFWQLLHQNVKAFKDSSGWHLLIYNACMHLTRNGKCAIYETRPMTCHRHSTEKCEYKNSIAETSTIYFDSFQSLESYCRKKFKTWNRRF